MATGDAADFAARIRRRMPFRWFADDAPILTAVLVGLGTTWAQVWSLYSYVKAQTRIATAYGVWLDMIARDFFASSLPRRSNESDTAFRRRISVRLLREAGTREGVRAGLFALTGRQPIVTEPWRARDCGAYGAAGGYGVSGAAAWGSLALPNQLFVVAYRPIGTGLPNAIGFNPGGGARAGYGAGAFTYASREAIGGLVTDAEIYSTVRDLMPAGTIAWTAVRS
jgi:hypothetical protein